VLDDDPLSLGCPPIAYCYPAILEVQYATTVFHRNIRGALSVFFLAISLISAGRAQAQVSGATLTGTVTDASGATIPQAQIVITNVSPVLRAT